MMGAKQITDQRKALRASGEERLSSEYARWLRAVCEDPSDVTARLAYADWLEERGPSPRAELIRVQVALEGKCPLGRSLRAMTSDQAGWEAFKEEDPAVERLLRREWKLLAWASDAMLPAGWVARAEHERTIINAPGNGNPFHRIATFRRGFAEAAVVRVEDLVPREGYWRKSVFPDPPPGLLLFKGEPLTAVTLAGKRPQDYHNNAETFPGRGRLYGWYRGSFPDNDHLSLPAALWDRVKAQPGCEVNGNWADFPSEAAAREALSRACVGFGREWAGLPALKWGPLP
jgi:uncharacterized protein (TIGR02996 family)